MVRTNTSKPIDQSVTARSSRPSLPAGQRRALCAVLSALRPA
jgi:hypothetical protein